MRTLLIFPEKRAVCKMRIASTIIGWVFPEIPGGARRAAPTRRGTDRTGRRIIIRRGRSYHGVVRWHNDRRRYRQNLRIGGRGNRCWGIRRSREIGIRRGRLPAYRLRITPAGPSSFAARSSHRQDHHRPDQSQTKLTSIHCKCSFLRTGTRGKQTGEPIAIAVTASKGESAPYFCLS